MEQRKKSLIVGMAQSGVGAAKLLNAVGWDVVINDKKTEIPGLAEALAGVEAQWRLGENPETLFDGVSLVVISPIIPMTAPCARSMTISPTLPNSTPSATEMTGSPTMLLISRIR